MIGPAQFEVIDTMDAGFIHHDLAQQGHHDADKVRNGIFLRRQREPMVEVDTLVAASRLNRLKPKPALGHHQRIARHLFRFEMHRQLEPVFQQRFVASICEMPSRPKFSRGKLRLWPRGIGGLSAKSKVSLINSQLERSLEALFRRVPHHQHYLDLLPLKIILWDLRHALAH
jgi:hypothetical protein